MKFIHAADLHLDSPFLGLSRYPGAPEEEVRGATRRALENLVALAKEEQAAFVLIAGDVYDGDWKDYNTGLFFAHQMTLLRDASIPVYMISGNHDAKSQITRNLTLPANVHRFSDKEPETKFVPGQNVAIHGQGFATQAVTTDLASRYSDAADGMFNIGLLHTSATGREGHENYAPCTLETLLSKRYDYWALGHVHQREILLDSPYIVFPGNTQGRHIRETGDKGCTLVTVEDGEISDVAHRSLATLEWLVCEVDASDAADRDDVLERIRSAVVNALGSVDNEHIAAMRVIVRGACAAHGGIASHPEEFANEVRRLFDDASGGRLWLEKLLIKTKTAINLEDAIQRDDALGQLVHFVRAAGEDDELLKEMLADFGDLKARLPSLIATGVDGIDLDGIDSLKRRLPDIESDLIAALVNSEAAS